jgi:large subunit ribosomal protein L10
VRAEKKFAVELFQRNVEENPVAILTRYTGISSEKLNDVRAELGGRGSKFQVVKNRLFSLAASESGLDGLSSLLEGQVGVVYTSEEQSIDILKYLVQFKKEHDSLDLLGGVIDGNVYDGKSLQTLSRLPGKDMMRARFAGAIKQPLTGFAQVLRGRLTSVLHVINAIIEKRGQDGGPAAGSE